MWLKLVSNKLEEGSNIPLRSYRVDIQHLILIQFKHNEKIKKRKISPTFVK